MKKSILLSLVLTSSFALGLGFAGCGGERGGGGDQPDAPAEQTVDLAQESQRVEMGMTEAQVVEILGEPRVRVPEGGGERLTFWAFDAEQQVRARVYVSLDGDGKVVSVETIPL